MARTENSWKRLSRSGSIYVLSNSFAHTNPYTIEREQWEGGLDCIFQNKVGVEQNQKTLAFTHTALKAWHMAVALQAKLSLFFHRK